MQSGRFVHSIAAACIFTIWAPQDARAAGAAYQVDTSETTDAGACKVEAWASFAGNRDFIGALSPACGFDSFRPIELSVQMNRARSDEEWTTGATPKAKLKLIPTEIGSFGLAVSAQASFDLITRENTAFAATLPATLRLSEVLRINLNAGWLWDRTTDRHYPTYGAGFDLRTPDNVWTVTAEVFGQAGSSEPPGVTQPRFQAGLRWRPVERFNVDLIYGHNLAGETASWITLATVVRFPARDK